MMTSIKVMVASGLAALVLAQPALAAPDFYGAWNDNASALKQIGNLTITPGRITLGRTEWTVTATGAFDDGAYFKIGGVNQTADPMGCGPQQKVTYILAVPVANDPAAHRRDILVTFYGGEEAPDAATLSRSMGVCQTHPFGRKK